MGKPAARVGDTTSHGGSIVVGQPTVLIGGMPAARVGDMHVCPMMNPGTPPPPHVGGPITMGSAGVLIGGMPAARMGDMATCSGPPDTIAKGCPTVLIGAVSPGSLGSAGSAGGGGAAAARASAATAQQGAGETTTKEEHWIEFQFVDKAGFPVSGVPYKYTDPDGKEVTSVLRGDGSIRDDALSEGQGEVVLRDVYGVEWAKEEARPDEKVTFSAKAEGFEDGTPATVQIIKRDIGGSDAVVEEIEAKVKGEKVKGEWAYVYPEDIDHKVPLNGDERREQYSASEYFLHVVIGSCTARSGMLKYKDSIEIELRDDDDNPIPNEEYVMHLSHGVLRRGRLDANGYSKEEDIPPGKCLVRFPNVQKP